MSKKLAPLKVSKILVPIDGSEHSKKAVDLAVDMALKYDAEIYFLHALEERKIPEGFKEYARSERIPPSSYFGMVCETFVGDAQKKAETAGVKKVEVICERGNPADKILNVAKKNKVDMIIMGTRGLGGFSRAIMGSVSTKVCNHAHCTCITVK